MNRKLLILHKEKEIFASQLEAKRKASEKLEKLNQAKEQLVECDNPPGKIPYFRLKPIHFGH
jgi:hypothetical protein